MNNKIAHYLSKGKYSEFYEDDIQLINKGLYILSDEISQYMVEYMDDHEEVIRQVKSLAKIICMPYVYGKVMGKPKSWYDNRKLEKLPGRKVNSFKEDDIHAINKAAMQIANELKSTEFIL